jgi:hypothetical protein
VALFRLLDGVLTDLTGGLPHSQLAILPGTTHAKSGHAASVGYHDRGPDNQEDAVTETAVRDAPNPTAFRMQQTYRWVGEVVADLSGEQLRWQPNPTTPSIRFHLFHIARWGDVLLQRLTGADNQIWHAEGIAERWGFDPAALGVGESGRCSTMKRRWHCRYQSERCCSPTATACSEQLIRPSRPSKMRRCVDR